MKIEGFFVVHRFFANRMTTRSTHKKYGDLDRSELFSIEMMVVSLVYAS